MKKNLLSLFALLLLSVTGAQAEDYLYAEVDWEGNMTLMYGDPGSNHYYDSGYWDAYFWDGVTAVYIDESCWDYEGISLQGLFSGWSDLRYIDGFGYLNTEKVTVMSYMFSGCSNLTKLDLRKLNTESVQFMGEMFSGCSSLTSLDLSSFNTASVQYMDGMFNGCSSLTSLDLSSFNTEHVFVMDGMFSGCENLTSIIVGSGWNTDAVSSSAYMFYGCTNLPNYDADVTDKTNAHTGAGGYLTAAAVPVPPVLYAEVSGTTITLKCAEESEIPAGAPKYVENYGYYDWSDDTGFNAITTMIVDESCKDFNATSLANFFYYNFQNISNIEGLSNLNTSNVTDMSNMFNGCDKLASLDLSGFNTANVTDMSTMFNYCTNLTSINLSSFDTAKVTNMSYMFNHCDKLETIIVGDDWNTDAVTNSYCMFENCKNLPNYNSSTVDASKAHTGAGGYLSMMLNENEDNNSWISAHDGETRNLTLTRTLQTGSYNTFSVPFNMAIPSGWTVKELDTATLTGGTLTLNFADASSIVANRAYLVKVDDDVVNPTFNDVTISSADNTKTVTNVISFVPTSGKTALPSGKENILFLAAGNALKHPSSEGQNLKGFRAYFQLTGEAASSITSYAIDFGGETTGVKEIVGVKAQSAGSADAYNLGGQRVGDGYKGIVIVNGKKMIK